MPWKQGQLLVMYLRLVGHLMQAVAPVPVVVVCPSEAVLALQAVVATYS